MSGVKSAGVSRPAQPQAPLLFAPEPCRPCSAPPASSLRIRPSLSLLVVFVPLLRVLRRSVYPLHTVANLTVAIELGDDACCLFSSHSCSDVADWLVDSANIMSFSCEIVVFVPLPPVRRCENLG